MSDKHTYKGKVNRVKIIKALDPTLVYLNLEIEQNKNLKGLVAKNALTFLLEVKEGDVISVFGHYNDKNQFVVEKYLTSKSNSNRNSTNLPPHLKYPQQKK